jgi:hypothetical protein
VSISVDGAKASILFSPKECSRRIKYETEPLEENEKWRNGMKSKNVSEIPRRNVE